MARGLAEQPAAGDGKQRPLVPRSRCLPRLSRSVRCSVISIEGNKMVRWMRGLVSLTLVVVSLCPVTFADQESKAKKLDELMKLTGLFTMS